jgi:lysophospholipase L1-like esterase
VVLDTLGVPSADARFWLKADAQTFRAQMEERRPGLLLFVLGGNEVKCIAWGRMNRSDVAKSLAELIRRTRVAAPQAGCLVVGPIDATDPKGEVEFQERSHLKNVIAIQRRVAAAEGCAFYDFYAAMGGKGALKRFDDEGLLHDDHIHPRGDGLDLLGNLLARSILNAWSNRGNAVLGAGARR